MRSTTDRIFIDTNVLVYARDLRREDKRVQARNWFAAIDAKAEPRLNLQVLNELTRWLLSQEKRTALAAIRAEVEALREWGDRPVAPEEVELAWHLREHFGYQWFDCLLLAAAHRMGCRYLLTEDMTHGANFEGLTLIDPFRVSPDDLFQRT